MNYEIEVEGRTHQVQVQRAPDGGWTVVVDEGEAQHVRGAQVGRAEWTLDLDQRMRSIGVFVEGDHAHVQVGGYAMEATVINPRDKALSGGDGEGEGSISTPMPGIVVRILVEPGQEVVQGQVLLVIEAMKMENEYKSKVDGVVQAIHVAEGQALEAHTLLINVEPA